MRRFLYLILVAAISCQQPSEAPLEPFSLDQVELLEGPFKAAQQTDLQYILEMDVDRLLAPFMIEAGLDPLAPKYPNWEGDGLSGHIGGHYLSALAMMYAATGNEEIKNRFDYMLDWLQKCQQAHGNGYLGGIPDGARIWAEIAKGDIRADYFSLNGGWVPLYNIHKVFAGLKDAHLYAGSEKALNMWIELSDWWLGMTSELSDEQLQQMLKSEHGGLNEVFADLYAITSNQAYLAMAEKLSHHVLLDPLLQKEDQLTGMHANTQIPKVIGYQRVAQVSEKPKWQDASSFFWETVVQNRSVAFGGNSVREHFHASTDFKPMVTSEQGPETCNTYNMMRLSKMLFESSADTRYIDFYERAQLNHILSSQHPDGGFVYFTPARPRHYRVYSQPDQGMWCCVGSGLENHTKYGELIYANKGKDLYLNLFIASRLDWEGEGVTITQQTDFPEEAQTTIILGMEASKSFAINLRIPGWSSTQPQISVNGEKVAYGVFEGYAVIEQEWSTDDKITMSLPMETTLEFLPDSSNWAAYLYGPVVMAAVTDSTDLDGLWADDSRMGHVADGKFYPIDEAPVLVGNVSSLTELEPTDQFTFDLAGKFHSEVYKDLNLVPFYKIHEARYMMYWPVTDSSGLKQLIAETKKEEQARIALKEITVDLVKPGEQQPEADHYFAGEHTFMGYSDETYWRSGRGWFQYTLRNQELKAKVFQFSYRADRLSEFTVSLNGQIIDSLKVSNEQNIWTYPVSEMNRKTFDVKFEAINDSHLPRVVDVRLLNQ